MIYVNDADEQLLAIRALKVRVFGVTCQVTASSLRLMFTRHLSFILCAKRLPLRLGPVVIYVIGGNSNSIYLSMASSSWSMCNTFFTSLLANIVS